MQVMTDSLVGQNGAGLCHKYTSGKGCGLSIALTQNDSLRFKLCTLFVEVLRILIRTADRGDADRGIGCRSLALCDGGRQLTCRIFVRAIAEDDVKQQHAAGRIGHFLYETPVARGRINHGMGFAARKYVVTEVHNGIAGAFEGIFQRLG